MCVLYYVKCTKYPQYFNSMLDWTEILHRSSFWHSKKIKTDFAKIVCLKYIKKHWFYYLAYKVGLAFQITVTVNGYLITWSLVCKIQWGGYLKLFGLQPCICHNFCPQVHTSPPWHKIDIFEKCVSISRHLRTDKRTIILSWISCFELNILYLEVRTTSLFAVFSENFMYSPQFQMVFCLP